MNSMPSITAIHTFFKRREECERFYKLGRILGQGSFATVRLGVCKADGTKWAVKIIKRGSLAPEDEESLATEITILQRVNHPNIVHLKEVYDCKSNVYLVMEIMLGGELFDRIVHKEHYSEQEAKSAFKQIVNSVSYCHDINIVHRDLKPENLLYASVADDAPLKLADFGLAYLMKRDELMHSSCGTPGYVAPEILKSGRGGSGYGKEVDMWSIGVILYILLCGFPPFYDEDNVRLFASIQKGKFDFPAPYWDNVSSEAMDLIKKLLVVDPKVRFTAQQTLSHTWLQRQGGSSIHLSHFAGNMKAYNARRRLRHAIRTVQFLQMIHGFSKQIDDNDIQAMNLIHDESDVDAAATAIATAVDGGAVCSPIPEEIEQGMINSPSVQSHDISEVKKESMKKIIS